YAQSHQNDPLGAVVAREVIRTIKEDNLIDRANRIGGVLASGLRKIKDRVSPIKDVRWRGLMAAVDINEDADASVTIRIHRELVRRGYVVGRRPGINVLRLDPSLTIEESDIQGFLATFESVLTDLG
ncbi:MAG: aminotransferase class III-fold pyridoxal phosphate-dependent enzyme, partial [Candidatus Latescibacterota bacterium]